MIDFGADSFVEVGAACVTLVVLAQSESVRLATLRKCVVCIGVLLIVLAISAAAGAIYRMIGEDGQHIAPDTTVPGIIISAVSLSFMFALWYFKKKAAFELDSAVLEKDAACSLGCIHLSATLFAGSLIYELATHFGRADFWWIDAVATLILAYYIGKEGAQTLRGALRADFDGSCGCCEAPK